MLTKSDLSQIRKVVREEVETEAENTKSELQAEMKLSRMETQSDLRVIKDRLKNLEVAITKIHIGYRPNNNSFFKYCPV